MGKHPMSQSHIGNFFVMGRERRYIDRQNEREREKEREMYT